MFHTDFNFRTLDVQKVLYSVVSLVTTEILYAIKEHQSQRCEIPVYDGGNYEDGRQPSGTLRRIVLYLAVTRGAVSQTAAILRVNCLQNRRSVH